VYPLTSNIRLRAVTRIPSFSNSLPGLLVYYRAILLDVELQNQAYFHGLLFDALEADRIRHW
jgi:hypothetical protein